MKDLKIGDKVYTTSTHSPWEIIKETAICFYVVIFNGGSSQIDYISKQHQKKNVWFRTKNEANIFEVKELRRIADYIESKETK